MDERTDAEYSEKKGRLNHLNLSGQKMVSICVFVSYVHDIIQSTK